MDNHPAFTKDNREFLSRISDEVYDLSQDFQDYPEDSLEIRALNGFARLITICTIFFVLSNSLGLLTS